MNKINKLMRIVYGIYFLIAICFVAIRTLSAFGLLSFLGNWTGYVFTIVVQVFLLVGGSVFLFSALTKEKVKNTLKYYNVTKISSKSLVICIALGVIVFFLNIFVSSFFSSILESFGYAPNHTSTIMTQYPVWLLFVNILFTAGLPAICEELVHRGMVLNTTLPLGRWKAIWLSSILFGLLHLNIEQCFYAIIIGLFLGYITVMTRSIFPAMIIHFMNNALSVFLTFSSIRGLAFGSIFVKLNAILTNNYFLGVVFIIVLIAVLLYLLYLLTQALIFDNIKKKLFANKEIVEKFIRRQMFFMELNMIKEGDNSPKKIILTDKSLDKMFNEEEERPKKDAVSIAFVSLSIILMATLTIFTFVWGVI